MREFMGMSYPEACVALGLEQKHTTTNLLSARRTHVRPRPALPAQMAYVPPKPEPAVMPCKEWMGSASAFLAEASVGLKLSPKHCLPSAGAT